MFRRQVDIRFFKRQVDVQRENLASICRISVKSLLDYACLYSHVDDDCEEFINLCSVLEELVTHRLRPIKGFLRGSGPPRTFWGVLMEAQRAPTGSYFPTCIPNIEAIETLKSPKAKLRAFIRVALMEKRLSDYVYWLLGNQRLIRESYMDGALLGSEEANIVCADLIGLNAIDFNFCLKGNEHELLWPLEISYAPFLKYSQSGASQSSDEIEMLRLSGKGDLVEITGLTEGNLHNMISLQEMEKEGKVVREQKDYLEEVLRLRDRQLTEANHRVETLQMEGRLREREVEREGEVINGCVLELQGEVTRLRDENNRLRLEVSGLRQYKERKEMREVPMMEMAGGSPGSPVQMDALGSPHGPPKRVRYLPKRQHSPNPSDKISIKSLTSDQRSIISLTLREDSQSLAPLTGSLLGQAGIIDLPGKPTQVSSSPSLTAHDTLPHQPRTTTHIQQDQHQQDREHEAELGRTSPNRELNIGNTSTTTAQAPSHLHEVDVSGSDIGEHSGEQSLVFVEGRTHHEETTTTQQEGITDAGNDDHASSGHLLTLQPEKPDTVTPDPGMTKSDPEVLTSDLEAVTSDNEVVTPDPDTGSDNAWEMVSDTEDNPDSEC